MTYHNMAAHSLQSIMTAFLLRACLLLALLLICPPGHAAATSGEASFMIWQVLDGTTGSCAGAPRYTQVNYTIGVQSGCVNGTAYDSTFTSMQLQCNGNSQDAAWNMTLYGDSAICTGGPSTLATVVHSGAGCVNLQQYNSYFNGFVAIDCSGVLVDRSPAMQLRTLSTVWTVAISSIVMLLQLLT